jgi:hypothetical protein
MKILLDIKDAQGLHLLEVLKGLPYVRATAISDAKAEAMQEVREAVDELKLVLAGKKESRSADDFLNEL